jgi:hypothetical protein
MKGKAIILLMILSFMAAFAGCAGSKTYLMDVRYIPGEKAPPSSKVVGICPFEDARKDKGKETIGVRYRPGKNVDLLALKGISLSQSVTQAVEDYFVEKGFDVTDCKGWDKSPEGLDRVPKDLSLVIGGKIDSFMVEAKSGVSITNIRYTVKLESLIGKIGERKVVTRTVESSPKDKKVGFDPDKVKAELNSTLTEVIQELFK